MTVACWGRTEATHLGDKAENEIGEKEKGEKGPSLLVPTAGR